MGRVAELGSLGRMSTPHSNLLDIVWMAGAIVAGVVAFLFLTRFGMADAEDEIRRWAERHDFRIISTRRRFWVPLLRHGRARFYRVTVEDRSGMQRSCWFSCEHWRRDAGQHVDVIWDEHTTA